LDTLYNLYDKDGSGTLDYREFASEIFGRDVGGTPARGKASGEDLLQRLRDKLKTRGARGIIGLAKQFRIMDDNHSLSLDKFEFSKAMSDYMLGFSEGETQTLFAHFDFDRSGLIEYDEFLRAIRGPMSAARKAIVMKAFNKMDKDGSGMIDINDIRGVYTADKHPDVLAGKKTEQQVLAEFLETFETAHSMRNSQTPDHVVSKEEWVEYYNNVSASIDRDDYFALMMNNAWNLDGSMDVNKKKGWKGEEEGGAGGARGRAPPSRGNTRGGARGGGAAAAMGGGASRGGGDDTPPMNMTEAQMMDRFREKLAARGNRGIMGLGRSFKIADDDRSGNLGMEEFQKAIHDFRVGFQPAQSAKLFKVFDRDGSGTIDYDEFLRGVRGAMNEFRRGLALKAFNIMDKDGSGVLEIDDIRQRYNAKMHPDVKAGKKTEDEILYEFIDTFEQHHSENAEDARDGRVTKGEWVEYYNNVSMSIDRDDYFELMMNQTWNLKGDRVTKKGWGAEI
jgi:Ca2+-binding EF-hand superfamily protein